MISAHQSKQPPGLPTYVDLLDEIANKCEGYSGAALAGVARAAASHALERAVNDFSNQAKWSGDQPASTIMDCLVTREDFCSAVEDVLASMGNSDHSEEEESTNESVDDSSKDSSVNDELSPE